jgi:protein tyrosine phosphatase (PTP) superfamily phosphohydrolase (DUF442 family)
MKSFLSCCLLLAACGMVATVSRVADDSISGLLELEDGIYTGAAPADAAGFAALAELGVNTVVCVDSVQPDVELAAEYGLSYIHIPVDYDEINEHALLSIKRMIVERPDDVFYIHCHHGKHRGPAVAAIAWRQRSGCSSASSLRVLEMAGTSKDYPGLWSSVSNWQDSNVPEEQWPALHAVAQIESFAGGMAKLDRNWDRIKLLHKNNWKVPASHPDLVVVNEALQTRDLLRGCADDIPLELVGDIDFEKRINKSVALADDMYQALVNKKSEAVEDRYKELKSSCVYCHRKYRNE